MVESLKVGVILDVSLPWGSVTSARSSCRAASGLALDGADVRAHTFDDATHGRVSPRRMMLE